MFYTNFPVENVNICNNILTEEISAFYNCRWCLLNFSIKNIASQMNSVYYYIHFMLVIEMLKTFS